MDNHLRAIVGEEHVRKEHEKAIAKETIRITKQHAYSLGRLVKYFKEMIWKIGLPDEEGRSDELTVGYCDELLEDLGNG